MNTLAIRDEDFLELIQQESLQPHQIARDPTGQQMWPVYKLLWANHLSCVTPLYLSETSTPKAVWLENRTLTYLWHQDFDPHRSTGDHMMLLDWEDDQRANVTCKVVGPSKQAVFETAMMLWNVLINDQRAFRIFSSGILPPDDLYHWFRKCRERNLIQFRFLLSSEEESLSIERFRNSYCVLYQGMHVQAYLRHVMSLQIIRACDVRGIKVGLSAALACRALSVPARKISLVLHEKFLTGEEFRSVNIQATELCITICSRSLFPGHLTASILRQVAQSSRLRKLRFTYHRETFPSGPVDTAIPEELAKELARVIQANDRLRDVRFNYKSFYVRWDEHASNVLAALKQHKRLCCVNRDARSIERRGPISIDPKIDRDFLTFNRFFRLTQAPQAIRPSLVVQALSRKIRNPFMRNLLLLELNTDTLCELVQHSLGSLTDGQGPVTEGTSLSVITSAKPACKERPIRVQPARAAKRQVTKAAAVNLVSRRIFAKPKRGTRKQPPRAVKTPFYA